MTLGKFTYSVSNNSNAQPTFRFYNHLSQHFGFDKESNYSFQNNTLTSTNTVNFIPEPTVFIHSDICEGNTDILQEIYSNNSVPFSQINYQLTTNIDGYSKKLRTNAADLFRFYITDEDNNELDCNGHNILLTLLLYKKDDFTDIFKKYISWVVQKTESPNT